MKAIGKKIWVIAEGYIPGSSVSSERELISHETACIVNTNDNDANIIITIIYSDRKPAGPYKIVVPAERTLHLRFNDLKDPEAIPSDTDYSSIIESDVPVVVQHTRLDSRKAEISIFSTIAFSE